MDLRRILILVGAGFVGYLGWSQLGEDETLEARAQEAACRGHVCTAEVQKKHRDLFGWTFLYTTYAEKTHTLSVSCARPLWVFGEYQCAVTETDAAVDVRFRREKK